MPEWTGGKKDSQAKTTKDYWQVAKGKEATGKLENENRLLIDNCPLFLPLWTSLAPIKNWRY